MREIEYVEIDFDEILNETDLAVLIRAGEDFEDDVYWIPKSQIQEINKKSMTIPEWLAEVKGLI